MTVKTKETKREVVDTYSVYVAKDGTEFRDEGECRKYEESARCAVRSRLSLKELKGVDDAVSNAINALDGLMEDGSNVAEYYLWKPQGEDDIKNLLQWVKLTNLEISDRKWHGECNYRTVQSEIRTGETYILEFYEDVFVGLICRDTFTRAVSKMFDTLLSQ